MIVVPAAFDLAPSPALNFDLICAALVLAQLSLVLVENPIRHLATLRSRPGRAIGFGLSLSSTTAVVAVGMTFLLAPDMPGLLPDNTPRFVPAAVALPGITPSPDVTPGAPKPAPSMTALLQQALKLETLPRNLDPPLSRAATDVAVTYADGCHLGFASVSIRSGCIYGDQSSSTTVVLFGDSHAAQWFPALQLLSTQHHWRLVPFTKGNCGVADVPVFEKTFNRVYTECQEWRSAVMARIASLHPALVVTGTYFDIRQPYPPTSNPDAVWADGYRRSFVNLQHSADHVVWMVDDLYRFTAGPDCAAAHPTHLTSCIQSTTSGGLMEPGRRAAVLKVAQSLGVTVIDPLPWMCLDTKCPIVIGNTLVYRDNHHVSPPFSRLVAPMLDYQLPPLDS